MNNTLLNDKLSGIPRIKLFLALSRTPHGLLDMATPAFAALLWLGELPPFWILAVGLLTTFAGYTSVYAINDVIDIRIDREKLGVGGYCNPDNYLDAVMIRHPMAQGCLSFRAGLFWALGWGAAAGLGAYLLNPVCVLIFLAGCLLEIIYCLLWRVSPLRTVVNGGVKTTGAIAGVFAVDPTPSPLFIMVLFLSLFFWEIGGQNIPADWTDVSSDRSLGAQTIPARLGEDIASRIMLGTLIIGMILMAILFQISNTSGAMFGSLLSVAIGCGLLLYPATRLFYSRKREDAMILFNYSSHYPASLLGLVLVAIFL